MKEEYLLYLTYLELADICNCIMQCSRVRSEDLVDSLGCDGSGEHSGIKAGRPAKDKGDRKNFKSRAATNHYYNYQ